MRVFAVPSWSAFVFSLIYWACIAEPAAWVQTHASHNQKQREGGKRERRRRRWEKGCETCMERSRCLWKGKKSEEGAEKEKRQKSRQKDRELLFIYLFLHSPPPFFLARRGNRVQKRSSGQGCISEESPMLVAPLIMDGPQACSRWARQPQPQLRHFKKPLVGPLPSPSSHTGRSEAPENSETNPGEKGNLALPVLLTDGSTHWEATGPLCRNAQDSAESSQELKGLQDTQDASARGGRKGGAGGGHRSLVQMICSA